MSWPSRCAVTPAAKRTLAALAIALLAGCTTAPERSGVVTPIHVVTHGWHTGVVIPTALLVAEQPALAQRFGSDGWLEIGWGDAGFYQANTVTLSLAVPALLWPTPSVVHLVAVADPQLTFGPHRRHTLCVDERQLQQMVAEIAAAFAVDEQGQPLMMGPGLYGDSQFYQGRDSYHMLRTCNSWTAERLATAGVDISPSITWFAGGVMDAVADQLAAGELSCTGVELAPAAAAVGATVAPVAVF